MKFRILMSLGLLLSLGMLGACTHVKGVVLDPQERPVTNAVFHVGHPNGLGPYSSHKVNDKGEFDFWISPTDENFIYVWDGQGDGLIGPRKVDRSELNDKMKIYLRRGGMEGF